MIVGDSILMATDKTITCKQCGAEDVANASGGICFACYRRNKRAIEADPDASAELSRDKRQRNFHKAQSKMTRVTFELVKIVAILEEHGHASGFLDEGSTVIEDLRAVSRLWLEHCKDLPEPKAEDFPKDVNPVTLERYPSEPFTGKESIPEKSETESSGESKSAKLEQAEAWLKTVGNGYISYPGVEPPPGIGKKTIDQAIQNLGMKRLPSSTGVRWHTPASVDQSKIESSQEFKTESSHTPEPEPNPQKYHQVLCPHCKLIFQGFKAYFEHHILEHGELNPAEHLNPAEQLQFELLLKKTVTESTTTN